MLKEEGLYGVQSCDVLYQLLFGTLKLSAISGRYITRCMFFM